MTKKNQTASITVNTSIFSDALKFVRIAADNKAAIPTLAHVLFRAANGRLSMTATDLTVSAEQILDVDGDSSAAIALPAEKLAQYAEKLVNYDDVVRISFDTDSARLACGKTKATVRGITADKYPEIPVAPPSDDCLPAGQLMEAIKLTSFAAAKDDDFGGIRNVFLTADKDGFSCVATDGHRLSLVRYNAPTGIEQKLEMLIPGGAAKTLLRMLSLENSEEQVFLSRNGDNTYHFRTRERAVTAQKLDNKFPDFQRIVDQAQPHIAVIRTEALQHALRRAAVFGDHKVPVVLLELEEKSLVMHSHNGVPGETQEDLEIEYDGPEMTLALNAKYLDDFLSRCETESIEIGIKDATSMLRIRPVDDEPNREWAYYLMPMRI